MKADAHKKNWPTVRLGEVLRREARPVDVVADQTYREIGIRSHGKGLFHKQPVTGLELGNKRVFWLEPGDFVLNIVFAWEGAVGLLGPDQAGMIGSHRFPTFRADEARLDLRFLVAYFKTPPGLDLLGCVSPGGAGRNRTLSQTRFLDQSIPLPPLAEQRRVMARIEELAAQIHEARTLRHQAAEEADALTSSAQSTLSHPKTAKQTSVLELVGENGLRNGRSVKSTGIESNVRCLTLSAMRGGQIDIRDSKPVPMPESEAEQFQVRTGDVYVIRGNGSKELCGLAGVITEELPGVIFPDLFIQVALPKDRILPEFFVAAWNSSATRTVIEEKAKTTSGIWKINQGHILSTHIPVPPLAEQRRIVAELDAMQAEVDALKREQAATAAELDALLPAILDRAFKGGL